MRTTRRLDRNRCRTRLSILHHGRSIFFFNDTATTEIYTLSLHDALPICFHNLKVLLSCPGANRSNPYAFSQPPIRSEEHTSELQSQSNLVCRLLLEKKKNTDQTIIAL